MANVRNESCDAISSGTTVSCDLEQISSVLWIRLVPTLLDLGCPPSRMLDQCLACLATEISELFKFVKVDSDEEPQLASRYNVASLPTITTFEHRTTLGNFRACRKKKYFAINCANGFPQKRLSTNGQ